MVTIKRERVTVWVAVPIIGLLTAGTALAQPEVCDARTARMAANAGDFATICACTHVTPSFLARLQNRSDFDRTLGFTAEQCPGLAALLSEIPTAALLASDSSDGRNEDVAGASTGSQLNSGGENPGTGGDEPAESGNDGPGNAGTEPGGGPGDSGGDAPGDKPGKGGDKPGKGSDKPGKGGDKGNGGTKGNNGGGNGPEGSSPGRGHKANDDEN